jgi:16S rRNA G527 N7-methylase RsmG
MESFSDRNRFDELRSTLADTFHVELPESLSDQLDSFHRHILDWNDYGGLVSANMTLDDLWESTLDSLTLCPYLDHGNERRRPHWDIGSGGGFPGLVLAAALPDTNFALVERSAKKFTCLERGVRAMGLRNVSVQGRSFPEVCPEVPFTMTARAIERPAEFVAALESVWIEGALFLSQFKASTALFTDTWVSKAVVDTLSQYRRGELNLISGKVPRGT